MKKRKDKVVKTKNIVKLSRTSTVTISAFRHSAKNNALVLVEVLDENTCKVSLLNNKAIEITNSATVGIENIISDNEF